MVGAGVARTDRTPYIIYALSVIQAAGGVWYGTRQNDSDKVQALAERVARIETSREDRGRFAEQRYTDLRARVDVLEHHR